MHRLASTLLFAVALAGGAASAASPAVSSLEGDYVGTLGPLHLRLHLVGAPAGGFTGTLDSPDQGAIGLPCTDITVEGRSLSFKVPKVEGSWTGVVDGDSLSGTWTQRAAMPLRFTRDRFVPAAKPSPVDGIWLGTLQAGAQALRIQVTVKSDAAGREYCALDSLDQGAAGLECAGVAFAARKLSFDVPAVHGHWSGELSADGQSLAGEWSQGIPLPLNFKRQQGPWAPPPTSFDPAIAPVDAEHMQAVLERDLAAALKTGAIAPGTGAGVAIGVISGNQRRVFAFGNAAADSIFEIGSITKTFTALMLAQMEARRMVSLDQPVRDFLPAGLIPPGTGPEISLLDLVTQSSGLPRLPDNLNPADPRNPYQGYAAPDLYRFLAQHGLDAPRERRFLYSNLGVGLLGQALANRAGIRYEELLAREVTVPLGLRDTGLTLTPTQTRRFITGHSADRLPAAPWDWDALAGAGAIRSTAEDLLTYLDAELHPATAVPAGRADLPAAATLAAALRRTQELRSDAAPPMRIAMAWLFEPATGNYWHNGATGGFSGFAFFNPAGDFGAVVLMNATVSAEGSFADSVGRHISQRLAGRQAVSLASVQRPAARILATAQPRAARRAAIAARRGSDICATARATAARSHSREAELSMRLPIDCAGQT
jgi:CubicO group peptidase (beta-lactamase class C family)